MRTRQRLEQIHLHPDFALALEVTRRLRPRQTVLAGGCVRDALLGRKPKDLDLATAAEPALVEAAFTRTVDVGRDFGTIVVVEGERTLEVTTFRREDRYLDGRRPSGVTYTDITEDARRRDFTVNALFYDPVDEIVVDLVGGVADLRARHLRTVGDPRDRFGEDHLRMLRAVRFVAQLEFRLDEDAALAIRALSGHLSEVAGERVLGELKRLLTSPGRAEALALAGDLGVLDVIWRGCDVEAGDGAFESWENAFAHHARRAGLDQARTTLKAWRASRDSQRRVFDQLRGLDTLEDRNQTLAARVRVLGSGVGRDVRALARARGLDFAEADARLDALGGALPPPILTGVDLKARGLPADARMGELLTRLYDAQLEGRFSDRAGAEAWLAAAGT